MSATGRGSERVARDYYPTPEWCVTRLLEDVKLPGGRWLEPAVGDGAIARAVNAFRSDVQWTTCDIRPECNADVTADYVALGCPDLDWHGDVVCTNPPFSLAMDFVVESMRRARFVVLLLRLNWLGSEDRAAWLRRHAPSVFVLPNRPSFAEDGGTDATEYGWYVWGPGFGGTIRVLRTTPKNVRLRGEQQPLPIDERQLTLLPGGS